MGAELPIAIVALVFAVIAFAISRKPPEIPSSLTDRLQQLESQVAELQAATAELKQAAAVPPPLPRTPRKGGLDDLREQLRASAQEGEDEESPR
jgi:hypothetical protein